VLDRVEEILRIAAMSLYCRGEGQKKNNEIVEDTRE
jgi:hypothetical protein